jgi:hypothetical protein
LFCPVQTTYIAQYKNIKKYRNEKIINNTFFLLFFSGISFAQKQIPLIGSTAP